MFAFYYFQKIETSKMILWCYLIWYLTMLTFYFDPSTRLWLSSLGLSIVVGLALMLAIGPITRDRFTRRFWESLRLILCPFLVSSFSSLVKGKDFMLLVSPNLLENIIAIAACCVFVITVKLIKLSETRFLRLNN